MGKLIKTYCVPHPPILIPEIAGEAHTQCKKTYNALVEVAQEIVRLNPKRVFIVSPHGTVFSDGMGILYTPTLYGDLASFGFEDIRMSFRNDLAFVDQLVNAAEKEDIILAKIDETFSETMQISYDLDHGALVPLWFLKQAGFTGDIVHMTYGLLSVVSLYQFGGVLRQTMRTSLGDSVLIASGDLSHALKDTGPYNYSAMGETFDHLVLESFQAGNPYELLTSSGKVRELAKECGFRSLCIAWGCYDRLSVHTELKSYEAPFGVGYLVGSIQEYDGIKPSLVESLKTYFNQEHQRRLELEDDYIKLARHIINTYVLTEQRPEIDPSLYQINPKPQGCFVSIKTDSGLRGCIGTITPTRDNLLDEIVDNAIKSCSQDPRFDPIEEEELPSLVITVDVLMPSEPITSFEELNPKRYGVIVTTGLKKGLLLPNLEGVDTVEEQIRIAKSKAGIGEEPYRLERFEVIRHEVEDLSGATSDE
jgi:AmmeMemoRadiSam system protein A